uniref:Uncharacterized protein n=1 Tax=Anatid alphaherpesvirus 2 TaxID=3080522 RepID=A0AAU0K7F8_9ALPH
MTDAYGVVSAPVMMTDPSLMLRGRLTGGWKGRNVTVRAGAAHQAVLWRIPDNGRMLDVFQGPIGSQKNHAWFYHIGIPWFVGTPVIPAEMLIFLADRCREEIIDAMAEASGTLKNVFDQFQPEGGITVQPAVLMERDLSSRDFTQTTVERFETAVYKRPSVMGVSINCGCDRPGQLQCLAYSRILEELINEAIGGDRLARADFECSTDGLFTKSIWCVSGPDFHWVSRPTDERVPRSMRGERYVSRWYVRERRV